MCLVVIIYIVYIFIISNPFLKVGTIIFVLFMQKLKLANILLIILLLNGQTRILTKAVITIMWTVQGTV